MGKANNLKEQINKWAATIFMVFVAVLLLIGLTGADVITTITSPRAADPTHSVAKVNSEYITNFTLNQYLSRLKLPPSQLKTYTPILAGNLIREKLLVQHLKKIGFFPNGDQETIEFVKVLEQLAPAFKENGKFNLRKFTETIKKEKRFQMSDFRTLLESTVSGKAQKLMRKIGFDSDLDTYAQVQMGKIFYSVDLVAIDSNKKEEIVKSKTKVSAKEISDHFKKNFLKSNPKAKLNKQKRESIKVTLQNQKRSQVQKELKDNLKKLAANSTLKSVASKFKAKIYSLKDVTIKDGIKPPKGLNSSLTKLENHKDFKSNMFTANLNKIIGPVEISGTLYLFAFTKRSEPKIPSMKKFIAAKKSLDDYSEDANFQTIDIASNLKKAHLRELEQARDAIFENEATIEKYYQTK